MGLLDNLDSPQMALAMGLLNAGGPSSRPVSIGQGLAQGVQQFQQAKDRQELLQQQRTMQQMNMLKMSEMQRQIAENQKRNEALSQIRMQLPEQMRPMFDADPAGFLQRINKEKSPIKLGEGEQLLDPNTFRPLATGTPKLEKQPSSIQEYNFAKSQGYTGTFEQWDASRRRAGATSVTNNITNQGDNKYIDTRRNEQAKAMGDLEKAAQSAYNQYNSLDRFIKASEKGLSGGAAPIVAGVQNFIASFGYTPESLKDFRVMEQAIGDILGNKMAELGARGLTDQDMKILRQALPRAEIDKDSRVAIARIMQKVAAKTLNEYETARGEEERIYPQLSGRMPNSFWYQDYKKNRAKFVGSTLFDQADAIIGGK